MLPIIKPDWPAPSHIKAYTTTRLGGVSTGNYATLNLSLDKGDNVTNAKRNREILQTELVLPEKPRWLEQVHGTVVLLAEQIKQYTEADASYTQQVNCVCVIQTADCMPILICNRAGTQVAAIHAGWRGLANGIIEATLQKFKMPHSELLVWLGPAISAKVYEVGEEVREQFLAIDSQAAIAFKPSSKHNHWLLDMYLVARQRLTQLGVSGIYGGNFCTYTDSERFFSYRRDGAQSGRMASLIYIAA